jgi:hypothetical protein
MRRVAAASVAVTQPRRVVADGTASAAAVLNATSCSVTSTVVVQILWAEWVAGRADLTSDVAGNPATTYDVSGFLRMVGDSDRDHNFGMNKENHLETPNSSSRLMRFSCCLAPDANRKLPMRLLTSKSRSARWSPSSNSRGL